MKKVIIIALLTIVVILQSWHFSVVDEEYFNVYIIFFCLALIFTIPMIDINKYKNDVWRSIVIYTISLLQITLYNIVSVYINTVDIIDFIFLLPGAIGVIFSIYYNVKFIVKKIKK